MAQMKKIFMLLIFILLLAPLNGWARIRPAFLIS